MPAPHEALPHRMWQSEPTHVQCGFPGTTWTTTARASPSESGALGLLKGRATSCATYVRHPPFVRWSPIRRHVLDPGRRKLSTHSAPSEGGVSSSAWSILSTTASKPPWRLATPAGVCRGKRKVQRLRCSLQRWVRLCRTDPPLKRRARQPSAYNCPNICAPSEQGSVPDDCRKRGQ